MAYTSKNIVSKIPNLSLTSKHEKRIKDYPQKIFYPINAHKYNPNKKFMIANDQFHTRHGPILKFYAQLDDRGKDPREQMKFRNCHILYFVEDGKIKVYEPHQKNTGFAQGIMISKNLIPKESGDYYSLDDLNVGNTVTLFGKTFKILDCDPFTKNYLMEMGYRVGTPEPEVIDPVYADRREMDKHRTVITKHWQYEKRKPFLKSHPKKLHFYVIYNNRPSHFDEIRYASMYYDITNDTIKIIDEKKLLDYHKQLSLGNYDTCLILKPTKVPKRHIPVNPIGNVSSPIILNLNATTRYMNVQTLMSTRAGGANNRIDFLRDSNPNVHEAEEEYYTAEDFDLGKTINIFGFEVYIYNCDEFTKEFYRNEFNRELIPVPLPDLKETRYSIPVHKENFGNPEDSLQTCKKLPSLNTSKQLEQMYKASHKIAHKGSLSENLLNYYLNCRIGNNSNILTFLSKVVTKDVFLEDQYFVILWYLEDETIDITGLDLNFTLTGSKKGMYMKRRKLTKPHSELENAGTCYYTSKDLYVGNVIYAMKKGFLLVEADEYTLDYMERNCDSYPYSNIKLIMGELFPIIRTDACKLKSAFEKSDLEKSGYIKYSDFKAILMDFIKQVTKPLFNEQQFKTLARYYADDEYIGLRIEQLISKIQMELKKQKFQDFEKLKMLFRIFDLDNTENKGCFKPGRIYEILRSYPLEVDRDLLKSLVFKFPQCNGFIPYDEIVKSLNYFDNPAEPPDLTPYAININWERTETVKNINKISYPAFLKTLMEEKCPKCE